ncbi:CTP synthase [Camellia lanceoleosa]|uniref:CTP synthase n=1 Tax=Camellia lanceoleosa TaxID=1840588 RepID=A0ACC0GAQ6_9ERIC|nr:CTP synthase [Camellia lanceoleosa]
MGGMDFSKVGEASRLDSLCDLSASFLPLRSRDPYLNTDAGTMSPFEHGEVFVLDDGGEVYIIDFGLAKDIVTLPQAAIFLQYTDNQVHA